MQRQDERGAALIEMAILMPLLVLLLFGIWTTARAYNVKNTLDHAVREGARYAATVDPWDGSSPAAVRAVVDSELAASAISAAAVNTVCIEQVLSGADGCVVSGSPTVTGAPADLIVVAVEYPSYELNFILFSLDVDLNARSTSRWES